VEDTLDYEAGGASMIPGLATGPVIYASEKHSQLLPLMRRNFSNDGDIELVRPYYCTLLWLPTNPSTPGHQLRPAILWYRTHTTSRPVLRRESPRSSASAAGQRHKNCSRRARRLRGE
jgi:hypothetical protein